MGLFDFLFGRKPKVSPKPKSEGIARTEAATASAVAVEAPSAPVEPETIGVDPEIVAAITLSIYQMLGTTKVAVRIRRSSAHWAVAGRQGLMDSREFA